MTATDTANKYDQLLHAHETTQQPIQLLNTSHKALFSVGDIQIIIMACINNQIDKIITL